MHDITSPANLFQKTRNQTMEEFFTHSVKIGVKSFWHYFGIILQSIQFLEPLQKWIVLGEKSKSWGCSSCACTQVLYLIFPCSISTAFDSAKCMSYTLVLTSLWLGISYMRFFMITPFGARLMNLQIWRWSVLILHSSPGAKTSSGSISFASSWTIKCWTISLTQKELVHVETREKYTMLRHSMPRWSERSLRSRQHPYPELQSKAWNVAWLLFWMVNVICIAQICYWSQPPIALLLHWQARVAIAWLGDLTMELSRNDPGDEQMGLMSKAVTLGYGLCGGDDGIEKLSACTICMSLNKYKFTIILLWVCTTIWCIWIWTFLSLSSSVKLIIVGQHHVPRLSHDHHVGVIVA